jgi:hypothetical protein
MQSRWRTRWRDWRAGWRWNWITTGVVVLAVTLGIGYWLTREPAVMASDCRELYARARPPADRERVDDHDVRRRTTGRWNCGMLRRIGATTSQR